MGAQGKPVELTFQFDSVRNFSAMILHTNNMFSKQVSVSIFLRLYERACLAVSWRLKLFEFHPGPVEPNNDNEEFAESKQQRKTFHYQLHGGARAFLCCWCCVGSEWKVSKTLFFASLILCFSFSFRVRCCVNKNKRNIHSSERKLNNVLEFNQNIFFVLFTLLLVRRSQLASFEVEMEDNEDILCTSTRNS